MYLFTENRLVFNGLNHVPRENLDEEGYPLHGGACALTGLVSLEGKASNALLKKSLEGNANQPYRSGSVFDDDGEIVAVDGTGVLIRVDKDQMGQELTERQRKKVSGDLTRLQVARFEFALNENPSARASTRRALEACFHRQGLTVLGWKPVETDLSGISPHRMGQMRSYERMFYMVKGVNRVEDARSIYTVGRRINQDITRVKRGSLALDKEVWSAQVTPLELLNGFFPELLQMVTDAVIAHGRFATNVLAANPQPFDILGHNGEFNSSAAVRKALLNLGRAADFFNKVLTNGGSDSAHMNDAVGLMLANGVSLPEIIIRLMPPSMNKIEHEELKRLIRASMRAMGGLGMWEGPAGVLAMDGDDYVAHLDREGLRPLSRIVVADPVLGEVVGYSSEKNPFRFDSSVVQETGQLGAGDIDVVRGGELHTGDAAADLICEETDLNVDALNDERTFKHFAPYFRGKEELGEVKLEAKAVMANGDLAGRLAGFGWAGDTVNSAVERIKAGKPIITSLGSHRPLAILDPNLSSINDLYLAQAAIITNPPIDPAGEPDVIDTRVVLGSRPHGDPVRPDYNPIYPNTLLDSPIISSDLLKEIESKNDANHPRTKRISMTYEGDGFENFAERIEEIVQEVIETANLATLGGESVVVLSDRDAFEGGKLPLPAVYLAQLIHTRLVNTGKERNVSIVVESGSVRHGHDMGLLIAHGVSAVCPYMLDEVAKTADDPDQALFNLYEAENEEFVKMISKLGISTLDGSRMGYWFSSVGLSPEVVKVGGAKIDSKVGGLDLRGIYDNLVVPQTTRKSGHAAWLKLTNANLEKKIGAYEKDFRMLMNYVAYPDLKKMRRKISKDDFPELYKEREFSKEELSSIAFMAAQKLRDQRLLTLRDLLEMDYEHEEITEELMANSPDLEQIFGHIFESHMSLGALGPVAHRAIARGCNAVGVQSANGEGGEEPDRSRDGESASDRSLSRQIGTAGWGVDLAYLMEADEICIKIAQGAKPGEGGDLPGEKVNSFIASLRHVKVGTRLISPPPNHDIYSIEDLKARLRCLRALNPRARISLKVASMPGLGGISEGAVKAGADVIEVSGFDASTGAAGEQSVEHCGLPVEIGLADVHQALVRSGVRDRVQLRACGKMTTAKDFAKMLLMGADGIGLGTLMMIFVKCIACRQCHTNNCPTGITTQDWDKIAARFVKGERPKPGDSDNIKQVMEILVAAGAEGVKRGLRAFGKEIQKELVKLGFTKDNYQEMIGRTDLLYQREVESEENPLWADRVNSLDLSFLTKKVSPPAWKKVPNPLRCDTENAVKEVYENAKGDELISSARAFLAGTPDVMELDFEIVNTDREFGVGLAGEIYEKLIRSEKMHDGKKIRVYTRGTGGHNFGAVICTGMEFYHEGFMNDSCGQWMSGEAKIVIRPFEDMPEKDGHALLGNQACMSATGGSLYCRGKAGVRLGVRNSGATIITEGALDYPYEYMTAGMGVMLGDFVGMIGSRMTGGELFIYDPDGNRRTQLCDEYIGEKKMDEPDFAKLYEQLANYFVDTESPLADMILSKWETYKHHFVMAVPNDELVKS